MPQEELVETYIDRTVNAKLVEQPLVDTGPCKEITISGDELDLQTLVPQILSNPDDGGVYLNYGLVIMKDPDTGIRNMGIYRMQLRGQTRTGLWSSPVSHGGTIRVKGDLLNKPTEVAVCVGADPLLYIASQIPGLGLGDEEIKIAIAIRGEPYEMVKCETLDLEVPAHCELHGRCGGSPQALDVSRFAHHLSHGVGFRRRQAQVGVGVDWVLFPGGEMKLDYRLVAYGAVITGVFPVGSLLLGMIG